MTFESLAIAGLSIGLTMNDILDLNIGLTIGLLNERSNQALEIKMKDNGKENEDEVVIKGNAKMLMNM